MKPETFDVTDADLHPHLLARMSQRGVTREEIEQTLNQGWDAADAKMGTLGKTFVFAYEAEWEGEFYWEKEVTVYYKRTEAGIIWLTVKARYGQGFARR
ncbi:MAG: hypothetical protein FJ009_19670 [Chloroflexi bacterium]|nr:hypothetical protein [Chloroflexota bacterium]